MKLSGTLDSYDRLMAAESFIPISDNFEMLEWGEVLSMADLAGKDIFFPTMRVMFKEFFKAVSEPIW